MTRKAVILARGLGTRMQKESNVELRPEHAAAAEQGHKVLMPLHGRPFLDYVVDRLLRVGVREVCFVVAPHADHMRNQADRIAAAAGVRTHCAVQQEPLGTADAVLAAEDFAGDDPFILCNGDNLYPAGALVELGAIEGAGCYVTAFDHEAMLRESNIARDRIRAFSVITTDGGDRLAAIVEKPTQPQQYAQDGHLWLNMNLYRFSAPIFDACRSIEPDPVRGELELTAAVDLLVRQGETPFRIVYCEEGVLDLTSRRDIPAVERALLGYELSF